MAIACLLVFASSLMNAAFVLCSFPRNLLKFLWGIISLIVAFIGIELFWLVTASSEPQGYIHSLHVNTALIFIPIFFFHFALLLTSRTNEKHNELVLYYLVTLIYTAIVLLHPRLFIPNVAPVLNIKYYCRSGPLFYFLPVWMSFLMGYGLVLVYRNFTNASAIKRNQLKYFFAGSVFGVVGAVEALLPAMNVPVYPWGMYLVPICLLIVAYAIMKHQLMSIQIVFHKSLVYTLLISILVVLFFLCAFLGEKILQNTLGYTSEISSLVAATLIALLIVPIYHFAQSIINRMFYKGNFNQIAQENIRLQEEALTLERYKNFREIAQGLVNQIKEPLTRLKANSEQANLNDICEIEATMNQLSQYSQSNPVDFRNINLVVVLDRLIDAMEPDFKSKNLHIFKYYQSKSVIRIHGHDDQLTKALKHLFELSLQTAQSDDHIFVSLENTSQWVSLSIRHSGLKLTEDEVSKIFQPFFKSKNINCGLGLVLAQSVIHQHGGKIWVEHNQDSATEFLIELPLV